MRQRQMFGAVARIDVRHWLAHHPPQVTGYPAWPDRRQVLRCGMRTLRDLQAISGFDPSVAFAASCADAGAGGRRRRPVGTSRRQWRRHRRPRWSKSRGTCRRPAPSSTAPTGPFGMQRFGAEALKSLPYVECATDAPDGGAAAGGRAKAGDHPTPTPGPPAINRNFAVFMVVVAGAASPVSTTTSMDRSSHASMGAG